MKKLITVIGMATATLAGAQVVTFDTSSNTLAQSQGATMNANQQATGVSGTPQLSRVTLTPGSGAAGSFFSTNSSLSNTLNLATNYVGFTVTPSAGNVVFATGINWTSRGSNTAPNNYATAFSTDGFATSTNAVFTGTTATSDQARTFNIPDLITNNTLAVRLYNYGATGINASPSQAGGSFRVITPTVTGSTVSTASGAIALAAATEIRNSTALTLGGEISGAQAITKTGAGTLTLSGTNIYSGITAINAGTLEAGNVSALGSGTVSVQGGTLATTVTNVNTGNANMASGAFSLNGASSGTLTLSSGAEVAWSGGTWNLSITSLASFDSIIGGGAGSVFAISGTTLALSGSPLQGTYDILTGFTSGSGSFSSVTGLTGGRTAFTSISGGVLTLTVVPEPHEYAMAIAGLLGLLIVVRRVRHS